MGRERDDMMNEKKKGKCTRWLSTSSRALQHRLAPIIWVLIDCYQSCVCVCPGDGNILRVRYQEMSGGQ